MRKESSQQFTFYQQLGENIRNRRKYRKLSQERLADLVGLTRTSMTNIEKGRQRPPLHTLCEIIEHLRADIGDLLPRSSAIKAPSDIKALAGEQVRGDAEMAFIETAIKGRKTYGDAKTQNSGIGGKPSRRKRH
ncbi:MAG: helix-turn-helix domain-containing protein [bacterium]